jgi:hypothetical protein
MSKGGVTADMAYVVKEFVDYNEQVALNKYLNESVLCLENTNMDLKMKLNEMAIAILHFWSDSEDLRDSVIEMNKMISELESNLTIALAENETLKRAVFVDDCGL